MCPSSNNFRQNVRSFFVSKNIQIFVKQKPKEKEKGWTKKHMVKNRACQMLEITHLTKKWIFLEIV